MSPTEIGLILLAILILIVLLGIHVGIAMLLLGAIGVALIGGLQPALSSLAVITWARLSEYVFAVIPLFLLMGYLVSYCGIGSDSYDFARTWFGQVRGGLAMATVGACGLFAACSGSSTAGAVTMGKISFPEMERLGYDPRLALGCTAAGGTLGILIPPSMGFILVGVFAELSIGKLFMAGIIPGILEIIFYWGTIYILCRMNPQFGPAAPPSTFQEKMRALKLTWPVILLFLIVMGGIYGGVFTPTEAGAIGAAGALVISLSRRRLSRSIFHAALVDTALVAGMLAMLLMGAFIFTGFLAITRIPYNISEFVVALELNRYLILCIILVFYIVMGMFFDIFAVLVITIPILYPPIEALGFDPIWFGVILVRVAEIGLITPPFGINLFALAGATDARLSILYRGVIPFIIADILHVALLVAVPQLSTFIPSMMR